MAARCLQRMILLLKRYAAMFSVVLIFVESFLFFGGYALFDFAKHPYLTGAILAFIISAVIQAFVELDDKIETLQKRVKELEEQNK